ncbi:YdcF family protein [Photobacterium nomapromontoriensis]|uniref:YdcF family protein n=1 Tax=Photobacterium nomapromontoriensis TaxID=2910237 RepID=UPI003D101FB4
MESLFIQQALDVYNSTSRSHYALFGQTVTNLDATVFYLQQAQSLASPAIQTDITISLANIDTFKGNIQTALTLLTQTLHSASPHQYIDILCYLVVWQQAVCNMKLSQTYLSQLNAVSPTTAQQITTLLDIIKSLLTHPIHYLPESPTLHSLTKPNHNIKNGHAIVTLGYKLNSDGTMAQPLLQRLKLTLILAKRLPNSLIIVTGGLATAGNTEAQLMKRWLIHHGINTNRIIEENQAMNTIENVFYSLAIIQQSAINHITLVSASIHVHRTHILFDSMQRKHYKQPLFIDHIAVKDKLATQTIPCGQTRINCYIDALRGFGLPAFRCGNTVQY